MATNKQRRESERQRLQRQLEERRAREVSRRRNTTIGAVVGALVVVAAVVVIVVASTSGGDGKQSTASKPTGTPTTSAPTSAAATCGQTTFPTKKYPQATGKTVTFDGVTVKGATDLKGSPVVTSKASTAPAKLEVKDLVVGTGAAASATSCVDVQYSGVLYKTGKAFDSSWSRGQVAEFSLAQVVPGFTQGIGGTTGVAPMKVGGRRIIIMPAALGYGAQAQGSIPANSPLVFIVDLVAAKAG